ncbi:DUF262 domain-containing protein [Planococcus salinus]|nr:DUF262 domain-containing protein [Planococcus salinus]
MSMTKYFNSDGLVSIERLLSGQDFYEIPVLQRNYVWSKNNIQDLLDDINASMDEDKNQDYFIGSMVFIEKDSRKVVIDGQQRITTLSLIFSSAIKKFEEHGLKDFSGLYAKYLYDSTHSGGDIVKRNRLKQHTKDNDFYSDLIRTNKSFNASTTSQKNMQSAKEFIDNEIKGMDIDILKDFVAYLSKRVFVVSMVASDFNIAFRIFETLNDRGAKLQPEDLLKNMLLKNLKEETYEEVANKWDSFIKVLTTEQGTTKVSTSTFLKHYIMSRGVLVQKAKLFEAIEKNQKPQTKEPILEFDLDTDRDVKKFINDLYEESILYVKAMEGKYDKAIDRCMRLGIKQTLVIVLASKDLEETKKRKVYDLMESLIFSIAITNARTNELEKSLFKVAGKLRKGNEKPEMFEEAIRNLETLVIEKKGLTLNSLREFKLTSKQADRKKAKYILEKMASSLDEIDHSAGTIEHIMPEEKSDGWLHIKRNSEEYDELVSRLGNLTLLNFSNNSSLKNKPFQEKVKVYKNQPFITKSIVEKIETGTKNTKLDKALRAYNYAPTEIWDEKEIKRRTEAMVRLGEFIWFQL